MMMLLLTSALKLAGLHSWSLRLLERRAAQVGPGQEEALALLGLEYELAGRVDDAILIITKSLKLKVKSDAEYAFLQFELGNLFETKGELGRALNHYKQALPLESEFNPQFRTELAARISRLEARLG
jgi:tetratricopeptide (TPR) repeat protein